MHFKSSVLFIKSLCYFVLLRNFGSLDKLAVEVVIVTTAVAVKVVVAQ